ncbi:MAG: ISAs1 family transposase [Pseudonocardiaceae bacterium]
MLAKVNDRRSRQGRMYELVFLLAVSLVAVLAGASNFRQIGDQVADLPQSLLRKLGAKWCYFRCVFGWPSEPTIRRALENIDADELDLLTGAWLRERACRDTESMMVLAIDGKVLRGAWTDENDQFTLFSAMIHGMGVTVAQMAVPAETNEITQVETLLAGVPEREGQHVVVTMDAAHTQRDTAKHIVGNRGFDYVMTVKGNQPTLLESVFRKCLPLAKSDPDHGVEERGHGRINRWSTWITGADGIDFPYARQVGCIRREGFTLAGDQISKEYAWIVTSRNAADTTAVDLHTYVRNHWGIENKSHYVRDVTWREDAHQAYTGSGPQAMATLRNMAAGLLRLNGSTAIKEATEWIGRDRTRALPLLAT